MGTQKNRLDEHPKHMFKLMDKKIIAILCKLFFFMIEGLHLSVFVLSSASRAMFTNVGLLIGFRCF